MPVHRHHRSLIVLCAVIAPATAHAADKESATVRALTECRAITDAGARLACYDRAAAALAAAVASGQAVVLDREGVQRTKRALFGFQLPRVGLFGSDDDRPEFQRIETIVARVVPLGYGKYEFVLEDGARWQSTDTVPFAPRSGSKIRISKAALGSYFINIDGRRGVKGRRVG